MSRFRFFANRRVVLRMVTLAVAASVLSVATVLPASAYITPGRHLVLHRVVSAAKCLDADRTAGSRNGAKVQIWDCNNDYQQQWVVTVKPNGYLTVQNGWSGNCLDADLNTIDHNTIVQLWACNNTTQQEWREIRYSNGSMSLVNRRNGKVLDSGPNGNGTPVILFNPPLNPPDAEAQWNVTLLY